MSEFLSFHLSDDFLKKYEKMEPEWGFDIGGGNSLSELTFIAKYSRKKEDGSKERWYEVCQRCIEGMYSILRDHTSHQKTPWNEFKAQKAAQDAFDRMFHFKWTPPGRGLWAMGTAFTHERGTSSGLLNCACVSTEKISIHSAYDATLPFVRLMEMSMNGIGVGFDTLGAGKLTIWEPTGKSVPFVVPDSREGWAESLKLILESYFFKNRQPIEFDYSEIRPAGAPLKTFGGTASGYEVLEWLHTSIEKQFAGRHGDKITSRDIVDLMNKIGKIVSSGGVRRSAELSLGSPDDDDYINLKNWELPENAERTGPDGWAFASNNSVVADVNTELDHLIDKIAVNGEPGIVWLDVMRSHGRLIDPPRFDDKDVTGVNPCCLYGKDRLLTKEYGLAQIEDLAEMPGFTVYNGNGEWMPSQAWKTGQKEVFRLRLTNGLYIDLTEDHVIEVKKVFGEKNRYHEFLEMEAGNTLGESIVPFLGSGDWVGESDIEPDDALFFGIIQGDGSFRREGGDVSEVSFKFSDREPEMIQFITDYCDRNGIHLNKNKDSLQVRSKDLVKKLDAFGFKFETLPLRTLPDSIWSQNPTIVANFLKGLFSANGAAQPKYNRISLKTSCEDLAHEVQMLLVALGFGAYITTNEPTAIQWDNGVYTSRRSYDVNIGTKWGYDKFQDEVGFLHAHKMRESLRALGNVGKVKSSKVASIESLGVMDVYDFHEADAHWGWVNGFKVHNSEIQLNSHETCCLVELYPTRHDDIDDMKKSIKHAFLYAKAVTLLPSLWGETNEVVTRNRRIGVSMTGIAEFVETRSWSEIQQWMDTGYQYLVEVDEKYSKWLGVRNSIRLSCAKPSGTTSILAGTTPGGHWPTTSGHYIRRVRFHKTDPLVDLLIEAGYKVEPDRNDPTTTVVAEFPTTGVPVRSEREVSIWEKAHLAVMTQRYWADNMVSVTVSFTEDERKEIAPLLRSLNGQLKSISFLPIDESGTTYEQAPYEPLDSDVAVQMQKKIKPLNTAKLYASGIDAKDEKFCNTDSCEISFG